MIGFLERPRFTTQLGKTERSRVWSGKVDRQTFLERGILSGGKGARGMIQFRGAR